MRYISAGVAEQQEGLQVLNLTANNLTLEGSHHVSAMLVRTSTAVSSALAFLAIPSLPSCSRAQSLCVS